MTFVYPVLLGGLLLAGLPVVVHFLIRKKPTTLLFPAFRFLIQKQRSNTRNLRLKHLLLLLLRIALIALVCFALSRPRLFQESLGLSREKPVAMVLLFDTSPSMGYKVGETTRLEFAKKRALDLLEPLPEDCRVFVLDSVDPESYARVKPHRTLDKARQQIRSLAIQPRTAPMSKAIEKARPLFDTLEGDDLNLPRFVGVFSDRTKASWDSNASVKPHGAKTLYFDVGIDDPVDLAITHVELPRDYQGQMRQAFAHGEKIAIRAVVQSTGQKAASTMVCQIGANKLEQAFDVEPAQPQAVVFTIDSAQWGLRPGFHQAEIQLAPKSDLLAFNNRRFVTFQIVDRPRVLVLADDLKATEKLAESLRALLYTVDHKTAGSQFNLGEYQAIFLASVAAPDDKLWHALGESVQQGRGLCVIPPGDEMKRSAYNSELAQKLLPARFGEKITVALGSEWNLRENDLQHPFMRPFVSWLDLGNVDFLRLPARANQYWDVKPNRENDVIVRYADPARHATVIENRLGKDGKVLLLTTPFDERTPEWNNYSKKLTSFWLALPMLCARFLIAKPGQIDMNFEFGPRPPLFAKAPFQIYPKYLLVSPDSSEETRFDDSGRWFGDRLTKAGNYSLLGTNPELAKTEELFQFSVNVPGAESDLTRVASDEIEAVLGPDSVVAQDRHTALFDTIGAHWSEPVELFPWLMIALLFLLALEGLLANRFYRQEADAPA